MPIPTRARTERVSTFFFSGACFVTGLFTLANRLLVPSSMEYHLSSIVVILWGMLLVIGAVLSVTGLLQERLRIESTGSLALAIAFFVYGMVLAVSGFLDAFVAVMFFMAFTLTHVYKAYALSKVAKERELIG